MFKKLTAAADALVERYLPDPYVLVLILTLFVYLAGIAFEGASPVAMIEYWGAGFWNLLEFSMQMVLVLVTGFILANTPPAKKLLARVASLASNSGQAILIVTVVALVASWINWGFGLIIGALLARQLAREVPGIDYRLLIASAYSGFVVWHGGLSGSIPLVIATEGHFTADLIGVIPTTETIFAPFNLIIVGALFVAVPLTNRLMLGHGGREVHVDPEVLAEEEKEAAPEAKPSKRPADYLENSLFLSVAAGVLGIGFLVYYFATSGFALNLNIVNFTLLFLGLLLHQTPRRFLASAQEAVTGAVGIIIQFPFYAGIMSMMADSGLAESLSQFFVSISTATTLPLWAFLSAGIVNFLVPSGGGQWAVQAPVMLPASAELGVDAARTAMAVAWGDAWTNMIQPFWALPALAIAGLGAKDIMGFCLMVLLVSGVLIATGLVFL